MAYDLFLESFDKASWHPKYLWTGWQSGNTLTVPGTVSAGAGMNENGFEFNRNTYTEYLYKVFPGSGHAFATVGFRLRIPSTETYYLFGDGYGKYNMLAQLLGSTWPNIMLYMFPTTSAANAPCQMAVALWNNTAAPCSPYPFRDSSNNTVPSHATLLLNKDQWYYIELVAEFDTAGTATGNVRVLVDGAEYINLANVKTASPSTVGSAFYGFLLGGFGAGTGATDDNIFSSWPGGQFDDVYCAWGDAEQVLGDTRIAHLDVTADGVTADEWLLSTGTNASAILNGTTAGYVYTDTTGKVSMLSLENLGFTPEDIHAVQVAGYGKKDGSGTRSVKLCAGDDDLTPAGESSPIPLGTSDAAVTTTFLVDPRDSGAWDETKVNSLFVGLKSA